MKNITAVLILFLIGLQSYAQGQKTANFTEILFSSEFAPADKNVWPLKSTQFYKYYMYDGSYIVSCKYESKNAFIYPKSAPQAENFLLETKVKLKKSSSKASSAGLALQVQSNNTNGFVMELNTKGYYRFGLLDGTGRYISITKGKNGWVKSKSVKSKGKENKLGVLLKDKQFTIYVNDDSIYSYKAPIVLTGQNGLYIKGSCDAIFRSYTMLGEAPEKKPIVKNEKSENEIDFKSLEKNVAESNRRPDSNDNEQVTNSSVSSSDVQTFTKSILDCKKENQQLQKKYDLSQIELIENRKKVGDLQSFIQQHLDVKLQAEVEKLKAENAELNKKLADAKLEIDSNAELKKFVEQGAEGDLVIVLSDSLKKEQEANKKLEEQVKSLQYQLKVCKQKK